MFRPTRWWAVAVALSSFAAPGAATSAHAADPPLQARIFRAQRKVLPALVHIVPVQEYYVGGERRKRLSTGSGVLISPEGYVLTNSHVVGKEQRIVCILSDEREATAEVVGSDPLTDLAVLKLDEKTVERGRLPYAHFGDSDTLKPGEFVLALGSPFGLAKTVSVGVVSTTDRVLSDRVDRVGFLNTWIQTDAAINPGNSGGPLVDLRGRIIGINARGLPGVAENIGFAIPGNLAQEIAHTLIEHGRVRRSTLGLDFQSIESVRGFIAWTEDAKPTGAIISGVDAGGPGQAAGLRPGDILTVIDGKQVDGRYDQHIPPLRKWITDLPTDTPVTLTILRGGESQTVEVAPAPMGGFYAAEFQAEDWGLTVTAVTDALRVSQRLEDTTGVYVASTAPGKPGHEAGLRQGDVIYFVDGQAVEDLEHFKTLYHAVKDERRARIMLEVKNGSFFRYVLLKPKYEAEQPEPDADATDVGADTDDEAVREAAPPRPAEKPEPAETGYAVPR